jgi:hypothetical protein
LTDAEHNATLDNMVTLFADVMTTEEPIGFLDKAPRRRRPPNITDNEPAALTGDFVIFDDLTGVQHDEKTEDCSFGRTDGHDPELAATRHLQ